MKIVLGILTMLTSLWLPAYVMSFYKFGLDQWWGFPTFITSLCVFVAGLALTVVGLGERIE